MKYYITYESKGITYALGLYLLVNNKPMIYTEYLNHAIKNYNKWKNVNYHVTFTLKTSRILLHLIKHKLIIRKDRFLFKKLKITPLYQSIRCN